MTAKMMHGRALRGVQWRQFFAGGRTGKPLAEWAYVTDEFPTGIPRSELSQISPSSQAYTALTWLNANFEPLEPVLPEGVFQFDGDTGSGFDTGAFDTVSFESSEDASSTYGALDQSSTFGSAFGSGAFGTFAYGTTPYGGGSFGGGPFGGGPLGGGPISDGVASEAPGDSPIYFPSQLLTDEFGDVLPTAVIDTLAKILAPKWVWRRETEEPDVEEGIATHEKLIGSARSAYDALAGYDEVARRLHNNPPEPLTDALLPPAEISDLRGALEKLGRVPERPSKADVEAAKAATDTIQRAQSRLKGLYAENRTIVMTAALTETIHSLWSLLMEVVHWVYAWIFAVIHTL